MNPKKQEKLVREDCGPTAIGCATWNSTDCTLHYQRGDTLTRRHECTHCTKGEFHR